MYKSMLKALLFLMPLYSAGQGGDANGFQKLVDFLPPPPNASAILKYSALSINKNTGSPAVSIPIFTVKGKKLSASVSIGYSSTGIKVDEIASRVGMGWALNAGGVVTRTVRGVPDEWNTRVKPYSEPIINNCGAYNFMNNVTESLGCNGSGCNGYDAEPDLFNFNMNGHSGSFIYDSSGQPILIKLENYKIEKNLSSSAWNFRITDDQGIKYYFGGTGATEKTKRLSSCAKTYDEYITNSWYLIKIEHPNGETISFTYTALTYDYDNGVSETKYWRWWMIDAHFPAGQGAFVTCPTNECPPAPANTRCINQTRTEGVLLSRIYYLNDTVKFVYGSRSDCGDKLVSAIKHYNATAHLESVNFTYSQQQANSTYINETASGHTYTPYLTSLTRISSDSSLSTSHKFVYNDPGGRPPRLSFSQDHWGYFNGKINSAFIPPPDDGFARTKFPTDTANREPDPYYAAKGMLTKIVYPTGGIDLIDYEPNNVYGPATIKTLHEYNCNVTGTGTNTTVTKTMTFTIDEPQVVVLTVTSTAIGSFDTLHNKSIVDVYDAYSASVFHEVFIANTSTTRYLLSAGNLPAGTYTMEYSASGSPISTEVNLKFYPGQTAAHDSNYIVGGLRVKRILTGNPGERPMIKRYYYADSITNLNRSSLLPVPTPKYHKDYRNSYCCSVYANNTQVGPWQSYCDLTAVYSSSLTNLFNYGSGLISYGTVIESTGENFEGGAVLTKFYAGGDALGQVIWGNDIPGAPLTNFSSLLNGQVSEEIIYKKPSSGALFPVKKTKTEMVIDERRTKIFYGYNVNKKYNICLNTPDNTCNPTTTIDAEIVNSFDVMKYSIHSSWVHPDSVLETLYDENGNNPITTITKYYYDDSVYMQLSRTESTNSKGQLIRTITKYPYDYAGTAVYDSMVAKNILAALVNTKKEIVTGPSTSTPLSEDMIVYGDAGNNNYVPVEVKKSVKGNTLQSEGTINAYDANGNILEFTGKNDITTSVIWGYNYNYPVAQVVGASYSSAVAQLTGGAVTALQSMDGAALRSELNTIRTNLTNASVTTYTYKVMTGISSITDPNNKTSTYEYDSFNRLLLIRDQDSNVIKKNEYVYAGADTSLQPGIYFNNDTTKYYTCQSCDTGYTGNLLQPFYIPAGKYYSLISQQQADSFALADIDGQDYANRNVKCVNHVTVTCTGTGYKVVNCLCELGTRYCISTTNNGNGTYDVSYKYQWTDGSIGTTTYNETIACSGADKKMINCNCETAVKVCDTVINNGGGSYTVTYHYLWSDASTSSPITDTIACSGANKKMIGCNCETGTKIYTASVYDNKGFLGCSPGQWLCTYHYHWWGDNSNSGDYTECSASDCGPF